MAGIKKKKEFLTRRKAKTKTKMSATIKDIRKAKEVAESEINSIVKRFVEEFNLKDVTVDVSIQKHYQSLTGQIVSVDINTEIKAQI
jgi:hypothetical protein